MKFSKKLLTALLPIAATGAIVPAVSACNKGNAYVINFGDEVDCLNEKNKNYHTVDAVKSAIKTRVDIEQSKKVVLANLPVWTGGIPAYKQALYFDLIASMAYTKDTKFHLVFDDTKATDKIVLTVSGKSDEIKGDAIEYYAETVETEKLVYIRITGTTVGFKSFAYQNSTIGD